MNTIRQLCDRCVVLDKGKKVFEGQVEEAIALYMNNYTSVVTNVDLRDYKRSEYLGANLKCEIENIRIVNPENGTVKNKEPLEIEIKWRCISSVSNVKVRIEFRSLGKGVATSFQDRGMSCKAGESYICRFRVDTSNLCGDLYNTIFVLYKDEAGRSYDLDCVPGIVFEKVIDDETSIIWNIPAWGNVRLNDLTRL
jgi:lipopolysaccharide transport system ATP-binding protein